MSRSIWATLGIQATEDRTAIRRAYAARLKVTNPEEDPEGFQTLRAAYEHALALADYRVMEPADAEPDWEGPADPQPPEEPDHPEHDDAPAWEEAEPLERPGVARHEIEQLQLDFDLLQRLVDTEPMDPDLIVKAFGNAMRSPALEAVALRDQAEMWVASLILRTAPRADALLQPAIDAFGWGERSVGSAHGLTEAVVARQRGLAVLENLQARGPRQRETLRALMEPPVGWRLWRNRLTWGLSGRVRELLSRPEAEALREHADPEAFDWWVERLERRRPWIEWAVTAWLSTTVAAGSMADDASLSRQAWGLVALAAVAIAALGGYFAPARLRQVLAERDARPWPLARFGWILLALAMLTGAAFAPPSPFAMAAIGLAGVASFVWAAAFAAPDREGPYLFRLMFYFVIRLDLKLTRGGIVAICFIPLFLFGYALSLDLPKGTWGQLNLAILGAVGATAAGYADLQRLWLGIGSALRRMAILAAMIVAAAVTPFLLWAVAPSKAYTAPAALPVILIMLAHMAALPDRIGLGPRAAIANLGWLPLGLVGILVGEATGHGDLVLLFGGMWVLAIAVCGLAGSFREEIRARRLAPA